MSFFTSDTFNTGSIAAGASAVVSRNIGSNRANLAKLKVHPSASTVGYSIAVYKRATALDADKQFATVDLVTGDLYVPTSRNGSEVLEGWIIPYEDLDDTQKMHFRVTNRDLVARSYDVTYVYELPNDLAGIAFLQRGAGSVTREAQAKLEEIEVSVMDKTGIDPTGTSLSTVAIKNAYDTAVSQNKILKIPVGNYRMDEKIVPQSNITVTGDSRGYSAILYEGATDHLFQVPINTKVDNFCLRDFAVVCSNKGFLKVGDPTQTYDAAKMCAGWDLSRIAVFGPGHDAAGSLAIEASQYIDWVLYNMNIEGFEKPALWDRGGNSKQIRVRYAVYKHGPEWFNNIGACSDELNCEFLGPTSGDAGHHVPGTDYGDTLTMGAPFCRIGNSLFEPQSYSVCYIRVTSTGGKLVDISGTFSGGSGGVVTPDNSIICDNGYDSPKFLFTNMGPGNNPMLFGTTLGQGSQAQFIGCSPDINLLAKLFPKTKVVIMGQESETSYIFQAPGIKLSDVDRLDFGHDVTVNSERGVKFNNDTSYFIGRKAGAWPQPLSIEFQTDIDINPGTSGSTGTLRVASNGIETTANVGYIGIRGVAGGITNPVEGCRLFCDVSGGKRRLLVIFPSGAAQEVKIEP